MQQLLRPPRAARRRLRSRWRLCRLRMRRAPCGQAERAEREAGQMRSCNPMPSAPAAGNQLSSLCGTPPRPSYSPRKPAGTLSRRPSHSNYALSQSVATKAVFSFGPCTARFLFHKMEKKMGGASPLDKPPAGADTPPGRRRGGPSAPCTAKHQAASAQQARHPTARYPLIFLYNT